MKRVLLVKRWMYALFECPQHANEITKKHTLVVSGEFCMIPLALQNLIVLVM